MSTSSSVSRQLLDGDNPQKHASVTHLRRDLQPAARRKQWGEKNVVEESKNLVWNSAAIIRVLDSAGIAHKSWPRFTQRFYSCHCNFRTLVVRMTSTQPRRWERGRAGFGFSASRDATDSSRGDEGGDRPRGPHRRGGCSRRRNNLQGAHGPHRQNANSWEAAKARCPVRQHAKQRLLQRAGRAAANVCGFGLKDRILRL